MFFEGYDSGKNWFEESVKTNYDERFYNLNDNFVQACLGKADSYLTIDQLIINTESGIRLTVGDSFRSD